MFKIGDRVHHIGDPHVHGTVTSTNHIKGNFHDSVNVQWDDDNYRLLPFTEVRYLRRVGKQCVPVSPVQEVTRREIVDGEYGGIHVANHEPGHVLLGFEVGGDVHMRSFSAEQLSELIHIASQIREALEDV